jgi:predicted phosphoadenosine phosphosulfate sulfurtransferase
MWENRCYFDGIPDKAPLKLEKSMRVPSYRMIATALLKNDLKLTTLGFSGNHSDWAATLKHEHLKKTDKQMSLI